MLCLPDIMLVYNSGASGKHQNIGSNTQVEDALPKEQRAREEL